MPFCKVSRPSTSSNAQTCTNEIATGCCVDITYTAVRSWCNRSQTALASSCMHPATPARTMCTTRIMRGSTDACMMNSAFNQLDDKRFLLLRTCQQSQQIYGTMAKQLQHRIHKLQLRFLHTLISRSRVYTFVSRRHTCTKEIGLPGENATSICWSIIWNKIFGASL